MSVLWSARVSSRRVGGSQASVYVSFGRMPSERASLIWVNVSLAFMLCCHSGFSEERIIDPAEDPAALLQRLAMIRESTPPSRLEISVVRYFIFSSYPSYPDSYQEYTVNFDREKRVFDGRNHLMEDSYHTRRNNYYFCVYDGLLGFTYYEDSHGRGRARAAGTLYISHPLTWWNGNFFAFDPRVLGGRNRSEFSRYNIYVNVSVAQAFENDILEESSVKYLGRLLIDGINTWHIRVEPLDSSENGLVDYWIGNDAIYGWRVYQCFYEGCGIISYYDNSDYPWLPSKVMVYHSDPVITQIHLKNAEIVINDSSYWTWRNQNLPVGTAIGYPGGVATFYPNRYWDGTKLIDSRYPRPKVSFLTKILNLKIGNHSPSIVLKLCVALVLAVAAIFIAVLTVKRLSRSIR